MLGWKIPLMLLIWSVIVIGACSDTSPLYSFYPSPDPSIFFMFGRGLLHGLLPYVEMADSKGPLLVWIYYAAAWIDGHSFAGIFLIQCVTLFTTLLLACGTARFYLSQRGSLLASMLLCLFLFDSFPFQRGGGVEELCWPGMAAVVYGLVRYFRMRDRRSLLFLFGTAGVFAGAASMMKFSIAFPVCALGGVLCLWLWWNGRRKEAAVALGVALAGFLAVVVPCSAWLVSNGVWKEAMNEYLLCSVRYGTVSQDTTWWARLLRPGSGPLPVRRTDVGGRHLGSGDSGLASIKNAKGAPLYGPAVYLLQGGDVQRVQLLLQFHPFTHDDLGDYLLCGPGRNGAFPCACRGWRPQRWQSPASRGPEWLPG